jgi:hypothetical protein
LVPATANTLKEFPAVASLLRLETNEHESTKAQASTPRGLLRLALA